MKRIAARLTLSIGIVTLLFTAFLLYQAYSLTNRRIREVVEQQTSMALKFDLAIRKYVGHKIRPLMYQILGKDEFIPEVMSTSYVARSIFEDVRSSFPAYILKFSSDNPRNPLNQAGPEELKVIEYLNDHPQLEKWEGEIVIDGKPYMAKFSARRMKKECLRCHGDPKGCPGLLIRKIRSHCRISQAHERNHRFRYRRHPDGDDFSKIVVGIHSDFSHRGFDAASLFLCGSFYHQVHHNQSIDHNIEAFCGRGPAGRLFQY